MDAMNVSYVKNTLSNTGIFKGTKNIGEYRECKENNKFSRPDFSLPLDKIVKFIHTNRKIHQCNECSKPFTCDNFFLQA